MPRKAKINFDMEDISDISKELVKVENNFYTKHTINMCGSLRFAIPTPLREKLELHAGDICYFCQYSEGYYISFKKKPEAPTKAQVKPRKLAVGGSNTLYLAIPPMIKNQHLYPIEYVKLVNPRGFQEYEWQIQFLSIDSI